MVGEREANCFRSSCSASDFRRHRLVRFGGLCLTVVSFEQKTQSLIDAFVEEKSHQDACQQELLGLFKRFQCQGPGNGGKALQEIFQCVAAGQIVEEGLNRHSGPSKHGHAVHCLGISYDRLGHVFIVAQSVAW